MKQLTREQAAILGVYTGILLGPFSDLQAKIEEILGRPVWSHELGNQELMDLVKELIKPQLSELFATENENAN